MKSRIATLDMMRGLAVVLMVFGHALVGLATNGIQMPVAYTAFSNAFAYLRMPVLMLISGFLASSLLNKSADKWIERVLHFVYLYAVWMTILSFIRPLYGLSHFYQYVEGFWMPTSVLWFIWVLAGYTILIPLVTRLPRHWIVIGGTVLAMIGYSGLLGTKIYSYNNFIEYAVFFYSGVMFKPELKSFLEMEFKFKTFAWMVGGTMLFLVSNALIKHQLGWSVLGVPARMAMCLTSLYGMSQVGRVPVLAPTLEWLGRHTLAIYVAHIPLLIVSEGMFNNLPPLLLPLVGTLYMVGGGLLIEKLARISGANWLYERPKWLTLSIRSQLQTA